MSGMAVARRTDSKPTSRSEPDCCEPRRVSANSIAQTGRTSGQYNKLPTTTSRIVNPAAASDRPAVVRQHSKAAQDSHGAAPAATGNLPTQNSMRQYDNNNNDNKSKQVDNNKIQRRQVAPLASLDCSITEPIVGSGSPVSRPDTPTLSGYFDCDQLSDMVDDSLFEITAIGCLSESVFKRNAKAATNTLNHQVNIHRDDHDKGGEETPTNESEDCQQNQDSNGKKSSRVADLIECQVGDSKRAQMTLLASEHKRRQPENRHRRQVPSADDSPNAAGNVVGHRHRSKSARFSSTNTIVSSSTYKGDPTLSGGARGAAVPDDKQAATLATSDNSAQAHRVGRKTRSNPDVRAADNDVSETLCSVCRVQRERTSKKRERKRFTFSLFNLFTSGTSDNQSAGRRQEEICRHHSASNAPGKGGQHNHSDTVANEQRVQTTARRTHRHRFFDSSSSSGSKSGPGAHMKTRDSIKLTNQRKRRNNAVRLSTSYNDFQNEPTELLLDFSAQNTATASQQIGAQHQKAPAASSELRPSRSSNNIQLARDARSISGSGSSSGSLLSNKPVQQRQTKSVKFTTPDRVMILPTSLNKASGSCSNLPPADLLPSAPIIKRPVPKASSYSQTESNKGLLELLAKYEGNTELIMEINEKLKLTDTIASPISALDQIVSPDLNDESQLELANDEMVAHDQGHIKTSSAETYCETNSLVKPNNSNEAEEAGFSMDWIAKQRAFV